MQSQLPLFEQHSIRAKMHKFHAHFATLDVSMCTTCLESFPGLQLHLGSAECLHCSRDKPIPKLYSSANNMDPGPIPSELQVGNNIRESVDSLCRDGADVQYMQYLSKSRITSQIR